MALGLPCKGGADITTAAGDRFDVYADAVDAFNGVYTPVDAPPAAFSRQFLHVQDQKANGVDGGTFTSGVERTRDLNTVITNEIIGASLSSNQIALSTGTYYIEASAPAVQVREHRIKLRNISTSLDLLIGSAERMDSASSTSTLSFLSGRFALTMAGALEVQHRCTTTAAATGFGISNGFGSHEVYTDIRIWKVG